MTLQFRRLQARDLIEIEVQPSQRRQFGLPMQFDSEDAEALAAQPDAWTAMIGDRIACCIVIGENFPGKSGVATALFAPGIGHHHRALTRFARELVANSPLPRIEAVAIANDAERILERFPHLDPYELLTSVMVDATPQCRWAMLTGFTPIAVLRKFGAASETHVLFERIRA